MFHNVDVGVNRAAGARLSPSRIIFIFNINLFIVAGMIVLRPHLKSLKFVEKNVIRLILDCCSCQR